MKLKGLKMLRSQIRHTKVEQMTNRMGKPVVNQFIIHQQEGYLKRTIFQSYKSIIAMKVDNGDTYQIYLDNDTWDYSSTTGRYRNVFLGEDIHETRKKIKYNEYILVDLNNDYALK